MRGRATLGAATFAALLLAAVAAARSQPAPPVAASAYVVESSLDGRTLAARAADERRAMASITKLMTALVARKHVAPGESVVIPPAAARIGESTLSLRAGERRPASDLYAGTLVPSANDAATALALHAAGGSLPRFVRWMNAEAKRLGMADTSYRNPHGLDQPGHHSSARDSATLLRAVLRDPYLRRLARAPSATLSDGTLLESTDNLIGRVAGFLGGKTGQTDDAGWSQVAAARRDGVTITATVLGGPTEAQRDADLEALLDWGLRSYRPALVVDPSRAYAAAEVGWGMAPVALRPARRMVRPTPVSRPLVERVRAPLVVALPVRRGQRLGEVVVLDAGRVVARSPLLAARDVNEPGVTGKARYLAGRTVHHLFGWLPG